MAVLGLASPAFGTTSYKLTLIDVPGASSTIATGISNNGQIVGTYIDQGRTRGFLLAGQTFTFVDFHSSRYRGSTKSIRAYKHNQAGISTFLHQGGGDCCLGARKWLM